MHPPTYSLTVGPTPGGPYRQLYLSFSRKPDRRLFAGEELPCCIGDGAQIVHIGGRECGRRRSFACRLGGVPYRGARSSTGKCVCAVGVIVAFVVLAQQVQP